MSTGQQAAQLLIASDLHGSKEAMASLIRWTTQWQVPQIFLLGDLLDRAMTQAAAQAYFAPLLRRWRVVSVRGNNDTEPEVMGLQTLLMPRWMIQQVHEITFFLTHGDRPYAGSLGKAPYQVCCSGHTHMPGLTWALGRLHLNPGSIGYDRSGIGESFALYFAATQSVELRLAKSGECIGQAQIPR